jgi:hypothetical protein
MFRKRMQARETFRGWGAVMLQRSVHWLLVTAFSIVAFGAASWESIESAPKGEPVLVIVPGRDAPVVAICDFAGDWQVAWNGDLLFGPTQWAPLPKRNSLPLPACG